MDDNKKNLEVLAMINDEIETLAGVVISLINKAGVTMDDGLFDNAEDLMSSFKTMRSCLFDLVTRSGDMAEVMNGRIKVIREEVNLDGDTGT
jgi:hypothetical protein